MTSFTVPPGTTSLRPYEWCNLHGTWEGLAVDVLSSFTAQCLLLRLCGQLLYLPWDAALTAAGMHRMLRWCCSRLLPAALYEYYG